MWIDKWEIYGRRLIAARKRGCENHFSHPPLLVSFFFLDYKYVTVSVSGLRSKCFGKGLPVSPL